MIPKPTKFGPKTLTTLINANGIASCIIFLLSIAYFSNLNRPNTKSTFFHLPTTFTYFHIIKCVSIFCALHIFTCSSITPYICSFFLSFKCSYNIIQKSCPMFNINCIVKLPNKYICWNKYIGNKIWDSFTTVYNVMKAIRTLLTISISIENAWMQCSLYRAPRQVDMTLMT